jgi:hypothetical protein
VGRRRGTARPQAAGGGRGQVPRAGWASEGVGSVAGDRDTLELYLEGMPLPPERLEGLAREVERVRLLAGEDQGGRRWLRVAAVLKPNGS